MVTGGIFVCVGSVFLSGLVREWSFFVFCSVNLTKGKVTVPLFTHLHFGNVWEMIWRKLWWAKQLYPFHSHSVCHCRRDGLTKLFFTQSDYTPSTHLQFVNVGEMVWPKFFPSYPVWTTTIKICQLVLRNEQGRTLSLIQVTGQYIAPFHMQSSNPETNRQCTLSCVTTINL